MRKKIPMKKKMKKNTFLLFIAGMILLSLNACFSAGDENKEKSLTDEEKWEKSIRSSYRNWERTGKGSEAVYFEEQSGYAGDMMPQSTVQNNMLPTPMQNSAAVKKLPSVVHTVVKGETLWGIARKYYGSGIHWRKIREANKERLKKGTVINPGLVLVIPSVTEEEKAPAAEGIEAKGPVENKEKMIKDPETKDSGTGTKK